MRDNKAWMFKEADSLASGAGKFTRAKRSVQPETRHRSLHGRHQTRRVCKTKTTNEVFFTRFAIHFALDAFITNSHVIGDGAQNFVTNYGADAEGLTDYLATLKHKPFANYQDGFEACTTSQPSKSPVSHREGRKGRLR